MTVAEAVRASKLELESVAHEESLQQAKLLVGYVLGIDERALPLHHQMLLEREQIRELGDLLERRLSGEPLQYILGAWYFMGLSFLCDNRALIPRPETEMLAEKALQLADAHGYTCALDLCCGSGCIGVSLAKLGELDVTAADISEDCLTLTNENAVYNAVQVQTVKSDLFRDIYGSFDLIVCNPPYLTKTDMDAMQPELAFEPRQALYGGVDGLDFYRRIAGDYSRFLKENGTLLLEIGATQAEIVGAMFPDAELIRDLSGLPRTLVVKRP